MKWKDVKILCAGMCICTVIAALNPIQETEIDNQILETEELLIDIETEASIIEETEQKEEVAFVKNMK